MGQNYRLLSINDTSTTQAGWMAREETKDSYTINVDFEGNGSGVAYLAGQMFGLMKDGNSFRNCVFTTHGGPGYLKFGSDELTTYGLYSSFYNRGFHKLFPFADAKVYFAGCQVAAGASGWKFLEAAARSFLRSAGGVAIGWTSDGWKIPFINHPKHFSGNVRQASVNAGGDSLRFYEDWKLITDAGGLPIRPDK